MCCIQGACCAFTVNTMPEGTLKASPITGILANHVGDCGDCEAVLMSFAAAGIDIDNLPQTPG